MYSLYIPWLRHANKKNRQTARRAYQQRAIQCRRILLQVWPSGGSNALVIRFPRLPGCNIGGETFPKHQTPQPLGGPSTVTWRPSHWATVLSSGFGTRDTLAHRLDSWGDVFSCLFPGGEIRAEKSPDFRETHGFQYRSSPDFLGNMYVLVGEIRWLDMIMKRQFE